MRARGSDYGVISKTKLLILKTLEDRMLKLRELRDMTGFANANVYYHLMTLLNMGFVTRKHQWEDQINKKKQKCIWFYLLTSKGFDCLKYFEAKE